MSMRSFIILSVVIQVIFMMTLGWIIAPFYEAGVRYFEYGPDPMADAYSSEPSLNEKEEAQALLGGMTPAPAPGTNEFRGWPTSPFVGGKDKGLH
jgi:hypothetical protein